MFFFKNKKLLAFFIITIIASLFLAVAINATDNTEEVDYTDYETASDYLGDYAENSNEDPDFETNSKIALETVKKEMPLFASFWALLPPIIAIVLALITKEVYSSLFVGIISGGLLAANFNFTSAVDNVVSEGIISAVSGTAGIFVFLVVLGALVSLINKAGGSAAFGRWAKEHIHTKTGALFATFLLGVLIFIDDYFNCLTVGSVMRPVSDTHNISRSKLAFIIDATAAPICMIAPISSWAAAVASYTEEGKGLELFIKAIPYNFYSLLTIAFVLGIIFIKLDFGPMKLYEKNAEKGDIFTSGEIIKDDKDQVSSNGIVLDLVFPIIVLIVSCVVALVYIGNGNSFADLNIIKAISETDATVGLPWGGVIALIISIIYFVIRRVVSFKKCMESIPDGFKAMVPAILILTMATSLKNMTSLLGANVFVAQLMEGAAAGLSNFLPAIIFLVACGLAFATGTSWGTFGILIPIVTAIFPADSAMMIIGISACLAGAVCGDHCSPISDTTIMSSAGAQCDHLNHVYTQIPYALTVAAVSFISYIIAAFVQNAWICLPLSIAILLGVMFCIKFFENKKAH